MSQFDLGPRGKREYDKYFEMLFKFFNNLEKSGNLSPKLSKLKIESDKRIFYSDQLRLLVNKIDYIVRTPDVFKSFLNDVQNHNFTDITLMHVYGSLLHYSILVQYTNIENLFLTMLLNSQIDTDDIIKGSEPLKPLLNKIFKLDTKKVLNKQSIKKTLDTKFRNSLAHGWIRIENRQIVYSENFDSEPRIMEYEELFERIIKLSIFGMALYHVVYGKEWKSPNQP